MRLTDPMEFDANTNPLRRPMLTLAALFIAAGVGSFAREDLRGGILQLLGIFAVLGAAYAVFQWIHTALEMRHKTIEMQQKALFDMNDVFLCTLLLTMGSACWAGIAFVLDPIQWLEVAAAQAKIAGLFCAATFVGLMVTALSALAVLARRPA